MKSRRQFLGSIAIMSLLGLAGCSAEESTETVSPNPTESSSASPTPAFTNETETELDDTSEPPERVGEERIIWTSDVAYSATVAPAMAETGSVLVGDSNGIVTKVAASDGGTQWTYNTSSPIQSTPTQVGDTVLAVEGRYNERFRVHGVDINRGTERWQFDPEMHRLQVLGATEDSVFIATSDQTNRTDGERLYALSPTDGTTQWTAEIGDSSGGIVTSDTVYVASGDTVKAISTDGSPRWTYRGSDHLATSLTVVGDTVVVVMASERRRPAVHGINASTGKRRWLFDEWRAFSLLAEGDQLFVGGNRLARLNPMTGRLKWEADLAVARLTPGPGDNRWIDSWRTALSDAVLVEDTLYVGGTSAAAVAVDDGTITWEHEHEAALSSPAGLEDDRFVLHASLTSDDRDRHLLAIDTETGERKWEYAGRFSLTDPVVGNSRVIFAESRSGLTALEL